MNEAINIHPDKNALIDRLYASMEKLPQLDIKPFHTFLPGQYIREIIMSPGTKAISKIHISAHPVFACGIMNVYNSLSDEVIPVYGYWKGITEPGTRRVFDVFAETIMTTVHAVPFITGEENAWSESEKEALALEIENIIIDKHDIQLNQTEDKEWLL